MCKRSLIWNTPIWMMFITGLFPILFLCLFHYLCLFSRHHVKNTHLLNLSVSSIISFRAKQGKGEGEIMGRKDKMRVRRGTRGFGSDRRRVMGISAQIRDQGLGWQKFGSIVGVCVSVCTSLKCRGCHPVKNITGQVTKFEVVAEEDYFHLIL